MNFGYANSLGSRSSTIERHPRNEDSRWDPARYRDSRLYKLWQLAVEATGDPYIGFKVASFWHPSTAHALGYAWLASATLLDALERTVRYYRLMTDKEELVLKESDEEFRLIIENPALGYPTAPEDLDASFAALVYLCRMCYGESFHPLRITRRRQEPPDPAPFEEFFRAPIQSFHAPSDVGRESRRARTARCRRDSRAKLDSTAHVAGA